MRRRGTSYHKSLMGKIKSGRLGSPESGSALLGNELA